MSIYERFFGTVDEEERERKAVLQSAHEILEFANSAYFQKYIARLERKAAEPVEVSSDHMKMVQSAVRSNTLKEVRDDLLKMVNAARAAMENENG